MRQHYTKCANPISLRAIEAAREDGPYNFVLRVFESGYDCLESDFAQTRTAELARLMENKDRLADAMEYKLVFAEPLRVEAEALRFWTIRRHWAETTSLEDDTADERDAQARRSAERDQAAIDQRAREILAHRHDVDFKKAQATAARELGGTNG